MLVNMTPEVVLLIGVIISMANIVSSLLFTVMKSWFPTRSALTQEEKAHIYDQSRDMTTMIKQQTELTNITGDLAQLLHSMQHDASTQSNYVREMQVTMQCMRRDNAESFRVHDKEVKESLNQLHQKASLLIERSNNK